MEGSIKQLAEFVFNADRPKPSGSIRLQLEETAVPTDSTTAYRNRVVSDMLMGLLMEGVRIKHGEHTNPSRLTEEDWQRLSAYIESCGYTVCTYYSLFEEPSPVKDGPSEQLCDFRERFYNFQEGEYHEIFFVKKETTTTTA